MVGLHVLYNDSSGNLRAAIVTNVRGGPQQKARLAVLNENATWTDTDNVPRDDRGAASTWRPVGA